MNNLITISREENGYCKIGNLIIQWGYVEPGIRNFPIPFPNKCLSLVTSGAGKGNSEQTSVFLIDKTKFEANQQQGRPQRYIAIGY
ncbi:gp53-like domain-containing protein [Fusobacterium necrophorum]